MPERAAKDPGDTAERLIKTARRLFAQRGYRGASIRAITAAAGANLGAVTYHFGTKRALYEAAVEQCLEPLRGAVSDVSARSDSPMVRIEHVLRVFFDHLRRNPDAPQFMLREVAGGEAPSAPVRYTVEQVLGTLSALVQEGQRDGSLRPADPRLTAVSIVAQPIHLTLLSQLLSRHNTGDSMQAADPDRIEQHAIEFVRAALQSRREVGTP